MKGGKMWCREERDTEWGVASGRQGPPTAWPAVTLGGQELHHTQFPYLYHLPCFPTGLT